MKKPHVELVDEIAKELAAKGFLIAAGWAAYERYVLPINAAPSQIDECRLAFFAGAQHLFGSIMSIMDPGADPTTDDLLKMNSISEELEKFGREFELRINKAKGSA